MVEVVNNLFNFDEIAIILLILILFIGICVASFSFRYMKGDSRYGMFFLYLSLLIVSVAI